MSADEIPAAMVLELTQMRFDASWALEREEWLVTEMEMRRVYYYLLKKQHEYNLRFHKGWELHNLGYSRLRLGDSKGAEDIALAYVEDVLSAALGDEDSADKTPAGLFLKSLGFGQALMDTIKEAGRRCKREGKIPGDPQTIMNDSLERAATGNEAQQRRSELTVRITDTFAGVEQVLQQQTPQKRPLEELVRIPYEKRCFIGGSYHHGGPALNDICDLVREFDYEPIVVDDFELRGPDNVHHDSLMVLNMCHKAIFEVTVPAGQLMELERCRDYDIEPLLLRNAKDANDASQSQVSAMIATMSGIKPVIWERTSDLRSKIEAYLRADPEEPGVSAEPPSQAGSRFTGSAGASPPLVQ